MANRLPVPPELLHLIEKRDTDSDQPSDRRSGEERRNSDMGPIGAVESAPSIEDLPAEDRRSHSDRRVTGDRRVANRPPDDTGEPPAA